jgi:hypothetical protein
VGGWVWDGVRCARFFGPFRRFVLRPVTSASCGAHKRRFCCGGFVEGGCRESSARVGGWLWDGVHLRAVLGGPFDDLGADSAACRVGVLQGSRTLLFGGVGTCRRGRARGRGRACQRQSRHSLTQHAFPIGNSFTQSGRRRGPWTLRGGAGVTPDWASDQWQKACIGLVTPNRIRHLSPAASPGWAGDPVYTLYKIGYSIFQNIIFAR